MYCSSRLYSYLHAERGLHTVCVVPEHPFELPEGLREVFQLVMEVNVLLDQGMNCILQLKGLAFQHKQSQGDQNCWAQSSHAADSVTSSDTGLSSPLVQLRADVGCFISLVNQGGDVGVCDSLM